MPITILEQQQRLRELGRIRLGNRSNGRPSKLDRFRFTSPSEQVIRDVATRYGGTPEPWDNGGLSQWQTLTEATRVPILLPPNPVSQWFELWSGGGCQRRCDGQTEVLADRPCVCDPDPEKRECKPTTRLNVILRDVPGMGVFRLESHGWYAAVELPGVALFAAQTNGMLPAFLTLEERMVKRAGQTRRFMVPAIEVDVTPAQLLAGGTTTTPAAVAPAERKALPTSGDGYLARIAIAGSRDAAVAVWREAKAAGVANLPELETAAQQRVAQLQSSAPAQSADQVWQQIVATAPEDWTLDVLEQHFAERNGGVTPGSAEVAQLQTFLADLQGGWVS